MADFDARFRSAYDWLGRRGGYVGCFPNFFQAMYPDGRGTVFGHHLLGSAVAEWQDVPRAQQGNPTDLRTRLTGAHDWATRNGFRHGFPTFHEANRGGAVFYGTILVRPDACEWRDVPAAQLGLGNVDPKSRPLEAWFRGASTYASNSGFAAGMPNGHTTKIGPTWVCGTILFRPGKADWQDVPGLELRITGGRWPGAKLVRGSGPAIYVIVAGARLAVPSWDEFVASGLDLDGVAMITDQTLGTIPTVPPAGTLLKERSRAEVYVIRDGQRLHIPTPYVLEALGYSWGSVQTVPNGSLAHIPADHWKTIGTPGSTVMPPDHSVYHPLNVATSKRHVAWGKETRTVELRGWLTVVEQECNAVDPDWKYGLLLDASWAISQGIDLNSVVKVGNILQQGVEQPGVTPRAWCAEPRIYLELSGHPVKDQPDRKLPPDWQTFNYPCVHTGTTVRWPFDPLRPRGAPLAAGQYVSVYGSILSDHPHRSGETVKLDAVNLWFTRVQNDASNLARWTEIHPPDTIEIIDNRPVRETFRGVTVAAPGSVNWRPRVTSTLDVDIMAPQPRLPGTVRVAHTEYVGPETDLGTIIEGNAAMNGAAVTELFAPPSGPGAKPEPIGVHVHVAVAGRRGLFGGSPGRFKALYRVYWT